jgi:hypothetical protein
MPVSFCGVGVDFDCYCQDAPSHDELNNNKDTKR